MADPHDNPKMRNLRILRAIRINSNAVPVGAVIAKSDFNRKGDWQNLANMKPAKVEETDAKVGPAPKATKATKMPAPEPEDA